MDCASDRSQINCVQEAYLNTPMTQPSHFPFHKSRQVKSSLPFLSLFRNATPPSTSKPILHMGIRYLGKEHKKTKLTTFPCISF